MNKKSLLSVLLIILSFSFTTKANVYETAAGEVYYQWVSDSTYRIFFRSYQPCEPLAVQANVDMELTNSCFTTSTYVSMPLYATEEITPSCTAAKTRCEDPFSSLPGYKQRVYSALVTLPYRCNAWKFSVVNSYGRIPYIFNLTAANFCVEATLNNTGSYQGNSSPYFNKFGILQIVDQRFTVFNNMAIDPNGDSLVTEVINPKSKSSWSSPAANVTLKPGSPALSIPSNPFQTNNTFSVNSASGQVSFTPDTSALCNVAFMVKKYRNGILIGSVSREVAFSIMNASTTIPVTSVSIAGSTGAVNTSGGVSVCAGQPFTLSVNLKSNNTASKLNIYDDHIYSLPGSTVSYTNMENDSVRATISWTPNAKQAGTYNLGFGITDANCTAASVLINSGAILAINVYSKPSIGTDANICLGQQVTLNASGGGNYTWSVLSGSMASLSCTNCTKPVATPVTNTTYVVTSAASAFCGNNKDTVNVNVNPNITNPAIAINAAPGNYVAPQTNVTFTATTTQCTSPSYQWKKNGTNISGATNNTYSTATIADNDIFSCQLTCNDVCATPMVQTSTDVVMHISTGINTTNGTEVINIYPNPNNGSFVIQGKFANKTVIELEIVNALGQKVYSQQIPVSKGEVNEKINLDLTNGVYILKIDNDVYRFVVSK